MANFATLVDALSVYAPPGDADVLQQLFTGPATPPEGKRTDRHAATVVESIARYPCRKPERLFALIAEFYPVPAGKTMRAVPFMPYLQWAPSAWVPPLSSPAVGF